MNIFKTILILICCLVCASPAIATTNESPTVAVIYPQAVGTEGTIYSLIESRLVESSEYEFVERESIRRVLSEQRSALGGMTRGKDSIALGKLISADILISCSLISAVSQESNEPLCIHVQVFEVASSLKLVDAMVSVTDFGDIDYVVASSVELVKKGMLKFPCRATGIKRVAVLDVACETWNRNLFPQAQAYINLLESILIESPDIALLSRKELGSTLLERFIEHQPPPLGADITIETEMRRTPDGKSLLKTRFSGQDVQTVQDVKFETLDRTIVLKQAKQILTSLQVQAGEDYNESDLQEEAKRLFIRAYVLTRKHDFEQAYKLAQAACVLDPKSLNARRLSERLYAKLVAASFNKWSKLSDETKNTIGEEARWYMDDYYTRLMACYRDNDSNILGTVEFLKMGALEGGYELGPEQFELSNLNQLPALAELHKEKRFQLCRTYKEVMEKSGDARMRHRPRGEKYFGPPLLYIYMELLNDDRELFKTARTYFSQESGTYQWNNPGAVYVKGYSTLFYLPPDIIVKRFLDGRSQDWQLLDEFITWLNSLHTPLADFWSARIIDQLWNKLPSHITADCSRQKIQQQCLQSLIKIAGGLNEDGAIGRQYLEKSMVLSRGGRNLWNLADVDSLQECWVVAKGYNKTCRAVVASKILPLLRKHNANEQIIDIASEALKDISPGQKEYNIILSALIAAEKKLGVITTNPPIWDKAVLLMDTANRKTLKSPFWQSFTLCDNSVFLCDTRNSEILRINLATGQTEQFSFADLKLPFKGSRHWHKGVVQDVGLVCAGRFWQPLQTGLLSIDLESGDSRVYNSTNGLFADQVTSICSVGEKIYGISRGTTSAEWNWRNFAGGGPFVLFELDPANDKIRNIDGSGMGEGRLAGSTTVSINGLLGDEERNGLWVMETWWTLGFPHFYDIKNDTWTRIRINAFDWQQIKACKAALVAQPKGMLFGSYLYNPDIDSFSYLPYFSASSNNSNVTPRIDISLPMTEWRGQVWGVSHDGRLSRVSADGSNTEYGTSFVENGLNIFQIMPSAKQLAVIATDSQKSRIQVWSIDPLASPETTQKREGNSYCATQVVEQAKSGTPLSGLSLPDMMSVDSASIPNIEGLAPGSKDAQLRQLAYCHSSGLPVETVNQTKIRFRLIPPGSFTMGSQRAYAHYAMWRSSEHKVTLTKPIYVSSTEITQGEWETIMGSNPVRLGPIGNNLPVEEVNWSECQEFLKRLCKAEGVPQGSYRMLTEAEWEYACRAGTDTFSCFGDNLTRKQANMRIPHGIYPDILEPRITESITPLPVASFAPNAWGLYDMHGSVEEWCEDKYHWTYDRAPCINPIQTSKGWRRVSRGGSRYSDDMKCSSFYCEEALISSDVKARGFGFRIVRIIE
ncbi:MAG: SUMF1/EgtB/PvdO family nonheme iron enzyme [Kiritimatiellae bacterium]|jgi:formylglycine-generating enzyme required for sulfatase activity|nr:SUMF1/EgtB/PvdO family nonheme iron enzyme [Kiritimatiellia bacterium]